MMTPVRALIASVQAARVMGASFDDDGLTIELDQTDLAAIARDLVVDDRSIARFRGYSVRAAARSRLMIKLHGSSESIDFFAHYPAQRTQVWA
jgi:hypothetical protein